MTESIDGWMNDMLTHKISLVSKLLYKYFEYLYRMSISFECKSSKTNKI